MGFLNWPYVEGVSAWGDKTSATRFCEMDCYATTYIVQFINTVTCAMYGTDYLIPRVSSKLSCRKVYLGARGIANTRRHGKDSVIILGHAMLIAVGLGSVAYHSTIKYTGQMLDEASMLYATATIIYGAFTVTIGETGRRVLSVIVTIATITVSIIHYCLSIERAFRLFFTSLVFIGFLQCVWLLSTRISDRVVMKGMKQLALYGFVLYVSGIVIWSLDTAYCAELLQFRDRVGMPLGFLSEGHGWWHILTGLGVYYYVVFIEYLRLCITNPSVSDKKVQEAVLIWPGIFSLPRVEIVYKKIQ
ncbi:ceramidase [Leptodontidium sp. MPI-SDFR-AT-0119]|nr:ceramidase [Leptodontidium sp. MPI-SDFR-AT-0119]